MFEFPVRRHFGSHYVIQLPLYIVIKQWLFCSQGSQGVPASRVSKGMVEIIVATVKHDNIQNGGTQKIQILKQLLYYS